MISAPFTVKLIFSLVGLVFCLCGIHSAFGWNEKSEKFIEYMIGTVFVLIIPIFFIFIWSNL